MTFQIRQMKEQDILQVAALERDCFSEPWSEKGFSDALQLDYAIFLVAEKMADGIVAAPDSDRDAILGYCGLYQAGDEGDITNVAVSRTARRNGIGDALIRQMKDTTRARGVQRIFLEVRESNLAAQKLYEKNGFSVIGMRKHFYQKPDENAILMMAETEGNTEC